ncbi:MAG TPA: zinc-ribbon domain-containing protein, partial [Kofleriaceae bacterium]|nr:zinc-ribbon domain-containing protein [Kofleriaceae bacterium]
MITATCEACGTEHRLPETLVPPSGKIMKCTACGKPVTVMPPGAKGFGFPSSAGPKPPARAPELGPAGLGPAGASVSTDDDDDDIFELGDALQLEESFLGGSALGDVPAPSRPSPLAGVEASHSPAPRSPLADADDYFDRPVDAGMDLPAPKRASGGVSDLPAPVRPGGRNL